MRKEGTAVICDTITSSWGVARHCVISRDSGYDQGIIFSLERERRGETRFDFCRQNRDGIDTVYDLLEKKFQEKSRFFPGR